MDEHYFLVAIQALAKQIDTLQFMNDEYQKEITRLKKQNEQICIDLHIAKGADK